MSSNYYKYFKPAFSLPYIIFTAAALLVYSIISDNVVGDFEKNNALRYCLMFNFNMAVLCIHLLLILISNVRTLNVINNDNIVVRIKNPLRLYFYELFELLVSGLIYLIIKTVFEIIFILINGGVDDPLFTQHFLLSFVSQMLTICLLSNIMLFLRKLPIKDYVSLMLLIAILGLDLMSSLLIVRIPLGLFVEPFRLIAFFGADASVISGVVTSMLLKNAVAIMCVISLIAIRKAKGYVSVA